LLNEYNGQKNLAEMGYNFDPDDLDVLDADIYQCISELYAKEMEEDFKKKKGKK